MSKSAKTASVTNLPAPPAPFKAVEFIYFSMQDRLNDMLDACKTREQRIQILDQFVTARHNYDECINQAFHQNDAALDKLVEQANASAAEIKVIDAQLANIARVIDVVTTAVTYGSKIAAKIIAA